MMKTPKYTHHSQTSFDMPLFKSHPAPVNEPAPTTDAPARKGSMFARRRSLSPDPATDPNHPANNNNTARRGFFGRGRASLDSGTGGDDASLARNGSVMSGGSGGSGFFGGRGANNFNVHKDPTIIAAREKVTSAENAEADADRALMQARAMVREARDTSASLSARLLLRPSARKRSRL